MPSVPPNSPFYKKGYRPCLILQELTSLALILRSTENRLVERKVPHASRYAERYSGKK